MDIRALVDDFAHRLQGLIEHEVLDRARAAVAGALGADGASRAFKTRRKLPAQFCPVPGCKNKAAPVFGMVCAEHKDVAKAKIKKYRDQRRAKKRKAAA
jgi:acyl transferase domain-containing protein